MSGRLPERNSPGSAGSGTAVPGWSGGDRVQRIADTSADSEAILAVFVSRDRCTATAEELAPEVGLEPIIGLFSLLLMDAILCALVHQSIR